MNINGDLISVKQKPYVIAELSANHNGSLDRAKKTIKAAFDSGASAIKIQSYTPDTMTLNSNKGDFLIKTGPWAGYKLYDLYKEAHTPFEWHAELFLYAKELGITIFSSPFDESAVDLLEDLDTPAYKIASFEICDLHLIKYIAATQKPILMSTGMASLEEIDEAVEVAKNNGCKDILLFHCISSYPAPIKDSNLKNIKFLLDRYSFEIGLSDHSIGNLASISAVTLGACAIEKHFTISRNEKGPDSAFSAEPNEFKKLVESVNQTFEALGNNQFERANVEEANALFRRSLYFAKDLKKGQKIKLSDIRRIRPGYGLKPKYLDIIIGKTLATDIEIGDRVSWEKFIN
ncbi:MAG: pseudaminic acid synthase [Prochlorococcus marinus XMU1428]|nr:pseudaminic acid synthase [Prochlorococcus marinus XMU1428]